MNRLLFALVLLAPSLAFGQSPPPGRTEVHTSEPNYQGFPAAAPIPPEMHVRNEGGSDEEGLCVVSSALADGLFQGVPGFDVAGADGQSGKGSLFWRTAKSNPGGYYPEKMVDLAESTVPDEGYASLLGSDPKDLQKLSDMGIPFGLTMNTAELYGWSRISHMVSYLLFNWDADLACYVDNNEPGVFTWISAREALARAIDPGMNEYWAWAWTRSLSLPAAEAEGLLLVAAAVVVVLVVVQKSRLA